MPCHPLHNHLHKHNFYKRLFPLGYLNVSTPIGATMAMLVSTEMGVTAPSNVSTSVPMTRPEMGTVIPPFTAGVPSITSTQSSPLVRPRLDD